MQSSISLLDNMKIRQKIFCFTAFVCFLGVLWLMKEPILGSPKAVQKLRSLGKKIRFVSNNCIYTYDQFYMLLEKLGYGNEKDSLVIPTMAIINHLKNIKFDREIFLLGSAGLRTELENEGYKMAPKGPGLTEIKLPEIIETLKDNPNVGAVIVELDVNLNYINLMLASIYLKRKDVILLNGGSDKICPFSKDLNFIEMIGWVCCVKINTLKVPSIINHGTSVILDCDFTLEESDQDLVVKWFFNNSLVYQWIPGTKKKPQGLGVLKDRLNLEYEAGVDANSIHRALHIIKAGPDLSGDYTCSVSTFQSEDIRTKSMLVYVHERYLNLRRLSADEGYMRVQCLAEGVFPRPVMTLHSQKREISEAEVSVRQKGRLYEISATATLPSLQDPEEFTCKLHIPQANYTTRRETVFYPGNTGNLNVSSRCLLVTLLITIICLKFTFIGGLI